MKKIIFALWGVVIYSTIVVESYYVRTTLYAGGNCGGHTNTNTLDNLCFNWPNFGYEVSGAKINYGSCVNLHYSLNCQGQTYRFAYPSASLCTMPCCGWNDHTLSVSDCDTRNVNINCPTGSYARKVVHGQPNEGITVYCYEPTKTTPTYTANTGGTTPSNPITRECPIASHGLTWDYNNAWDIVYNPVMECSMKFDASTENETIKTYPHMFTKPKRIEEEGNQDNNDDMEARNKSVEIQEKCGRGDALTGIYATIDDAGVIKETGLNCRKVTDPTSMCEPKETLIVVFHCDNSDGGGELTCSYSKTVGVGVSKSITETERQEMTFSAEFGYTVEAGIPGLSVSMSASLGYSELVGYEWSTTDGTTWTEETTISASVLVPPYLHIRMDQLVGKCSFYGTSANYFKTTTVNATSGETTITYSSM